MCGKRDQNSNVSTDKVTFPVFGRILMFGQITSAFPCLGR